MNTTLLPRIAAVLVWVSAVGLGIPCVICIRSLAAGRGIPTVFGFPAYGGGPFERLGLPTTIPLAAAFLLVCALDAAAGGMLWGGSRAGAIFALAMLAPDALFWWGFALPYPPVVAVVRVILIVLGWPALG